MRGLTSLLSLFFVLAVIDSCIASVGHAIGKRGPGRRHSGVNALDFSNHTLSARTDDVRYSYYDITTGEVACGGRYQPGDFVSGIFTDAYGLKTDLNLARRL